MAVATQHDWPRTGVHLHANSLEPNTRHSRRSGEVLRTRPESTLVGCRVDIGDGRPRCGPATTVTTHLLCGFTGSCLSAVGPVSELSSARRHE
jgi:hypothetical protein